MELFAILILIVLLILVLTQHNRLSFILQKIETQLRQLTEETKSLKNQLKNFSSEEDIKADQSKPRAEAEKIIVPSAPAFAENFDATTDFVVQEAEKITAHYTQSSVPAEAPVIKKPGFFERNPDIEKFIGENLVSKIGIAILVLAIGYFVKYAIDKDWVGPNGRVAIGILSGTVLIAIAHRIRNSYRNFSSVLAGGGIAVYYFTITLAFHQFQIFTQPAAFIILIIVTIFAVALSLLYNKQELAIIAMLGGFAAPFLVSNGEGNYFVLFTYLVILNAGLLLIAYYRSWRLLNFLCFLFTVVIFGLWLAFPPQYASDITYANAFAFAVIFYVMYFFINVAYNIRENKKFIASDFGILLANSFLFFSAGIGLLHLMHRPGYKGLFSAATGVFNLTASIFFFRRQRTDKNILYLLIAITLSCISLTAPLQLNGNFITIFWATEAVMLYWLFQKSQIRLFKFAAASVWVLMLGSMLLDWVNAYTFLSKTIPIVFNKAFITGTYASLCTYFLFVLRTKEKPVAGQSQFSIRILFRIVALVLLYLTGLFEISFQFKSRLSFVPAGLLYKLLYTSVYIHLNIFIANSFKNLQFPRKLRMTLHGFSLMMFLFAIVPFFTLQAYLLEEAGYHYLFLSYWFMAACYALHIFLLIRLFNREAGMKHPPKIFTWLISVYIVIFTTVTLHLAANEIFYSANTSLVRIQEVFVKTAMPVIWGICSFAFMWFGMHFSFRRLRIISLCLFTVTLLKLFMFDIRNIPSAGKIAAFFSLGILLLVVSFMYQRLKKIIIDEKGL